MGNDESTTEGLEELRERLEKLLRAVMTEVREEESDEDQYCA